MQVKSLFAHKRTTAAPAGRAASWPAWTDAHVFAPTGGKRLVWAEFSVCINCEDVERRAGLGLSADTVIDEVASIYRAWFAATEADRTAGRELASREELAAAIEDRTIWLGGRVIAVVRADPAGSNSPAVVRFDR